jgi:hypothetical protein
MKFTEWLDTNWQKDNILPPRLEPQKAIEILKDYLLGEDWYCVMPMHTEQINVEIVDNILHKYSKKYRKEDKAWKSKFKN